MQRDERAMVVWTDDVDTIIPLSREFEEKLIKLVCGTTDSRSPLKTSQVRIRQCTCVSLPALSAASRSRTLQNENERGYTGFSDIKGHSC